MQFNISARMRIIIVRSSRCNVQKLRSDRLARDARERRLKGNLNLQSTPF